jgi:hypothetical protein
LVSGLQLSIFPLSVNFGPRSVKNQGKMVKILIILYKVWVELSKKNYPNSNQ